MAAKVKAWLKDLCARWPFGQPSTADSFRMKEIAIKKANPSSKRV